MKNLFLLLVMVLLISTGCVQLKAPDHLVSDSVAAGKDVYYAISGQEKPQIILPEKNIFTYQYLVPPDQSFMAAKEICLKNVKEKASLFLGVKDIKTKFLSLTTNFIDESTSLVCEIKLIK
jgi:hypothetical protein